MPVSLTGQKFYKNVTFPLPLGCYLLSVVCGEKMGGVRGQQSHFIEKQDVFRDE